MPDALCFKVVSTAIYQKCHKETLLLLLLLLRRNWLYTRQQRKVVIVGVSMTWC